MQLELIQARRDRSLRAKLVDDDGVKRAVRSVAKQGKHDEQWGEHSRHGLLC